MSGNVRVTSIVVNTARGVVKVGIPPPYDSRGQATSHALGRAHIRSSQGSTATSIEDRSHFRPLGQLSFALKRLSITRNVVAGASPYKCAKEWGSNDSVESGDTLECLQFRARGM